MYSLVEVCSRMTWSSPSSPRIFLPDVLALVTRSCARDVWWVMEGGMGLGLLGVPGFINPEFVHLMGMPGVVVVVVVLGKMG